jgi:signal transduction histidine kinase
LILGSVRNRLVVLFFLITAAAIGFIYLYVVPQLRSSLTTEKLQHLEELGTVEANRLAVAIRRDGSQAQIGRMMRGVAQRTGAHVALLRARPDSTGPQPDFVVAASQLDRSAISAGYPVAAAAARSDRVSSAVESPGGARTGEVAVPLEAGGGARWIAVLSTPLAEIDGDVDLIRRQILIAGAIALAGALAAGWVAARAHAKRLGRLEAAAESVAEGNFSTPIPDEGADEVGQLARTLNEMQQRLARLDSARREFIANASHELRTPIFSLGGFVELLDEEEPDPAAREEFVQTMREQVARLTRLTADLLDLSKLDADAIEFNAERVDLGELARRVAGEFKVAADRHNSRIHVRAAGEATAMADGDRVAQIVRILLDNALTHTPEGTSISVTAQRQDGSATLVVKDDGPGIDAHDLARVFDRFYTGDRVSGSGLGLAIAQELTLRMEGELGLASRRGRTEFSLRLPAATLEGAPA